MKSFRTDLTLTPDPFFDQSRPILTLGSCFAEHIGEKLLEFKWSGLNAPFGTLFHPLALSKIVRLAVEGRELDDALFVEHDGAFFHHDLHSRFHAVEAAALQKQWTLLTSDVRAVLDKAPYVLLTLGTAWVYERKSDGKPVANCHKQPLQLFHKRLLQAEEIRTALQDILNLLPTSSSLILSLSPVRHTRDTLTGNAVSKSLLRVAIHEFVEKFPDRARYFPAYEIMLDELRDYRFYQPDMIHPSNEAVAYIWEKFTEVYATDATKDFLRRWQTVLNALRHRPLRMEAPSYQRYLQSVIQELESFRGIDCSQEKVELVGRLLS